MKKIYARILQNKKEGKKSLAILLDPDKITNIHKNLSQIKKLKPDWLMIGGSLLFDNHLDKIISKIKQYCNAPIILFPGNNQQISSQADALLFLSLISGRNPEFLIGQHVSIAPVLAKSKLEIIPTGYILIENGQTTSVEYISQTQPIPRKKIDMALATAMAGEMLGMKLIYLEAGSGASKPVPSKLIKKVSKQIKVPLIVGGGIKNEKQLKKAFDSGADIVVIGTAIEKGKFII